MRFSLFWCFLLKNKNFCCIFALIYIFVANWSKNESPCQKTLKFSRRQMLSTDGEKYLRNRWTMIENWVFRHWFREFTLLIYSLKKFINYEIFYELIYFRNNISEPPQKRFQAYINYFLTVFFGVDSSFPCACLNGVSAYKSPLVKLSKMNIF